MNESTDSSSASIGTTALALAVVFPTLVVVVLLALLGVCLWRGGCRKSAKQGEGLSSSKWGTSDSADVTSHDLELSFTSRQTREWH